MSKRYAIVDLETTGGKAEREKITEIGIVIHDGTQIIETFESLVNPDRPIPEFIQRLTGIKDAMVEDAPRFHEIAKQIVQLTEGCIFVAHNVRFDYGFLQMEFKRLGYTYSRRKLCTVRLSRTAFPGLKSYSLGNLIAHFNLKAERRHRALDDALATTELLRMALDSQTGVAAADNLVNFGIKESLLPKSWTVETIHQLPETPGVYYFSDQNGNLLYIGKSTNLRKRVASHFVKQTKKAATLQKQVHGLDFEETGSELVALLKESAEIKAHQPPINRTQKRYSFPWGIFVRPDKDGYLIGEVAKSNRPLRENEHLVKAYVTSNHARGVLRSKVEQALLCTKKLGLESGGGPCFNYHLRQCNGACIGAETTEVYNQRATEVWDKLNVDFDHPNFVIFEGGRHDSESSFVLVRNGAYLGYGFVDNERTISTYDDLLSDLKSEVDNPEVKQLIRGYLAKNAVKVIYFDE